MLSRIYIALLFAAIGAGAAHAGVEPGLVGSWYVSDLKVNDKWTWDIWPNGRYRFVAPLPRIDVDFSKDGRCRIHRPDGTIEGTWKVTSPMTLDITTPEGTATYRRRERPAITGEFSPLGAWLLDFEKNSLRFIAELHITPFSAYINTLVIDVGTLDAAGGRYKTVNKAGTATTGTYVYHEPTMITVVGPLGPCRWCKSSRGPDGPAP